MAWLGGYHARAARDGAWAPLVARGGQIQAALGIELDSAGPFSHVDVRFQVFIIKSAIIAIDSFNYCSLDWN